MEEATAKINFDHVWRQIVLCLILIGWGLWSVYDGTIGYPRFNAEHGYEKYTELRTACRTELQKSKGDELSPNEKHREMRSLWTRKYRPRFLSYLRDTDWWATYKADAATESESDDDKKATLRAVRHLEDAYHGTWDIRGQFIMAGVCLPLGLLAAAFLLRNWRRTFRADEEGLHGFASSPVPYAAIKSIDRTKWDKKGIAKLRVEEHGRVRKLTLDDWKFKGMNRILDAIITNRPDLARAEEEEESTTADTEQDRDG